MEIVPHLRHLGAAVVRRTLAFGGLVVPRTGATDVRFGPVFRAQSGFDVAQSVRRGVGGRNAVRGEPVKSRQTVVVKDDRFEEINDFFVLGVLRAVAWNIKSGKACGMLRELVLREWCQRF